jgi:acyl carrier protein
MQNVDVLEDLSALVGELLEVDDLKLTMATTAENVPGWDSLAHVRIVLAAEQTFGVRFTTAEIASLKKVGDLVKLIKDHQATGRPR